MAKQTFTTGQVLTAAQMTSLQQTAMGGGAAVTKTASYVLVAADAGTTIQMNSAGATTITVNTALFAAGDIVFIQNIGAGVCTVTAGTATVTTAGSLALGQYEGGQLFFNSTSASLFFDYVQTGATSPLTTKGDLYGYSTLDARIPIGTNNQVLTADSAQALGLKWATPTSTGSSYSLLNSGGTALTGSATTTISGLSGYGSLMINYSASTVSVPSDIYFRINGDTGANYNNYGMNLIVNTAYSMAIFESTQTRGATYLFLGNQQNAANSFAGSVEILGANSTGIKTLKTINKAGTTTSGANSGFFMGTYDGTSVVSSISIISGNGNFDGGTIYVYGSAV